MYLTRGLHNVYTCLQVVENGETNPYYILYLFGLLWHLAIIFILCFSQLINTRNVDIKQNKLSLF